MPTPTLPQKIIFYVDDDYDYGELFSISVTHRHPEYLVLPYYSAEEALNAVRGGLEFNLALIDRELDDDVYSGDDIIKECKTIHPDRPIICLSNYPDPPKFPVADCYLNKIRGIDTILQAIAQHLK